MTKLMRYLAKYRFEAVMGPLFKLLEASFELIVPLVVASIIDKGIAYNNSGYIIRMSLVLVLLGAVGFTSSVTAQYFAARCAAFFAKDVKRDLFKNIQSLSYEQIDSLGTDTLITRMTSDMNQLQQGVNLTLRLLLRSPFVVFGAMIMAFTIDVRESLIFLVTIILLSAVVFSIMLWGIPGYRRIQSLLDSVLGLTRENLSGVRVIRAFGREDDEIRSFRGKNESLTDLSEHVGRVTALMNPLTYVILNLAIVILLNSSAERVYTGALTTGAVVALYNYMSQILVELIKFANLIVTITRSLACGNRIESVLDLVNSMPDGEKDAHRAGDSEYILSFKDVSMRYQGSKEDSLSSVSFDAGKGESIGIIGGTGSGKSTLINLIPRFYDCTKGMILYRGEDVRSYTTASLREVIGVVPQKAVLFAGSIRDNLKWGDEKASDTELMEAAEAAQALDVIESKGGLNGRISQGGRNLSGGQRQRLSIARALVKKPDILILDDSSSALDNLTDKNLRHAIKELPDRPLTFIVSQRASSVRFCDKIIVLDDGKVAGMGTHDELLSSCDTYREIYESQYGKEEDYA